MWIVFLAYLLFARTASKSDLYFSDTARYYGCEVVPSTFDFIGPKGPRQTEQYLYRCK